MKLSKLARVFIACALNSMLFTVHAVTKPTADAAAQSDAARTIVADTAKASGEFNRFYNLSVGSDYAPNLSRKENLEHLALVVKELGFRSVRMHAIFHDNMEVFKLVDGKPVYDWTKIDALYDNLLRIGIKPFVELGFTPKDMATSDNKIFTGKAILRIPSLIFGTVWFKRLSCICVNGMARKKCVAGTLTCGMSQT
jgi:hypothetical protein